MKPNFMSRHACLDIKSREFMLSSLKEFVLVAWKDWDRGRNLTSNFRLEVAFQFYLVHWLCLSFQNGRCFGEDFV